MVYRGLIVILIIGLALAGGAIAYFGLGPRLAAPVSPPTPVQDAAETLGYQQSASTAGPGVPGLSLMTVDDEAIEQISALVVQQVQPPPTSQPQVFQVTDPGQLSQSEFFQLAELADLVLLYPDGQALLLRPSNGRILASGSVQPAN